MQITVKQLSKSYKDKTILDNVTFTIESGTVCGLLGVNGVGKSTLMKILWLLVNCSGLMKSYNLERTKLVLSFLMFKAMRILVLKLSKFRKPKAFRLMTLMRLLVASSFAFE